MKCVFKDEAGNKLFVSKDSYFAKNAKGELMSKHGLESMMREKSISTKGREEVYLGNKRK